MKYPAKYLQKKNLYLSLLDFLEYIFLLFAQIIWIQNKCIKVLLNFKF